MRKKRNMTGILYILLPVLGIAFLLWYISAAGADVVYSDYFRIIDEYLPDVTDPGKMLTPDILTRIPAMFVARIVNVRSFYLSVTFDRMLTVCGFIIIAVVLALYSYRHNIGIIWYILIQIILFSLIKWEIILNGTAWAHVVSFGLFFVNYYLFDLAWTGDTSPKEELLLCVMPLLWLLFAGEYIASYAVTMMLISILGMATGGAGRFFPERSQKLYSRIFTITVAALGLYILSRHFTVFDHAGASELELFDVIREDPLYLPEFFAKTFSGALVGAETIPDFFGNGKALPDVLVNVIGILMILVYIIALFAYFKYDLFEQSVFPLVLLTSGFINHAVVTAGRWIFLDTDYALSSRYGGQFMIGIIGIILIFSQISDVKVRSYRNKHILRKTVQYFSLAVLVIAVSLNAVTTFREIKKAKYREANYEHMAEVIKEYEKYPDEELCRILEWHKSPETLKNALKIIKDNKLNVFDQMR